MNSNLSTVSVYFADASELNDEGLYAELYAAAPQYRRRKTDKYFFRTDKNLSICAEFLLKCGCRDFGIDPAEQNIALGDMGKPYFKNSGISFNLSHSHERAMCAMSRYEVGCDIEIIRSFDPDIAACSCTQEELAAISACKTDEEKSLLFYELWTLKESFLKCTGAGVTVLLSSLSFLDNGEIIKSRTVDGRDYFLFDGILDGSYSYALCIQSDGTDYESVKEQISIARKSAKESKQLSEDLQ